jgi:hypothetical protein
MGIETAVIAGAAVAGAAASASAAKSANKPRTTTTTQETTPWAPQAQELHHAFILNRGILDNATPDPYGGDLSADMRPEQRAALENAIAYSNGQGAQTANQVAQNAARLGGATTPFLQNATGMAANGTGGMNGTAAGVLTAGANGPLTPTNAIGQAGQAGLGGALGGANTLFDRASGDPAQRALAMGGAYANDPTVQAQIDNAALDVTRNFNENTAPGLNARASAGGNLNSARAGIAEAVARRDAGESVGRIAATMRGNAFNAGVGASMEGNAQNNALALGANNQRAGVSSDMAALGEQTRQFDTTSRMNAANNLGQMDLAARSLNANTRLNANAQLGEAALASPDAAAQGMALMDGNFARTMTAGGMLQAEDQRMLDENFERYMRDYNTQRGYLSDFMSVAGSNNWGSSTTGTQTTPGAGVNMLGAGLQGALGGAMMGAGAYGYMRPSSGAGGAPKRFG